jgi:branched-subunit amino acid aminotransferase/4-amino-4-deoxychorismate lyase
VRVGARTSGVSPDGEIIRARAAPTVLGQSGAVNHTRPDRGATLTELPRIEIDGRPATVDGLWLLTSNYGHFTAMQVRAGRTRGLDLHLARLAAATTELFDAELDTGLVRAQIRHALGDDIRDASVRVYVYGLGDAPSIMVVVRPPAPEPAAALRLQSADYLRPVPHVKHLGGFGQVYFGRIAQRNGFDDALLTGPDGVIAEGAITNIAFLAGDEDGAELVWADAPQLAGITMLLLERGVASRRGTVRLADLARYTGAFVTNSQGIAPVSQIDDAQFEVHHERLAALKNAYDAVPWDRI